MAAIGHWVSTRVLNPFALYRWNDDRRVDSKYVLLGRNSSVRDVLTKHSRSLDSDSGFFRIGQRSLDPLVVRDASAALRALLSRHTSTRRDRAASLVEQFAAQPRRSQESGHWLVYEYFCREIVGERSAELVAAVEAYIDESLIRDDVKQKPRQHYARVPELRARIESCLSREQANDDAKDIVDISLGVTRDHKEAAQILQRLVLSVVGFTGAAIEWLLFDLAMQSRRRSLDEAFVRESLRVHTPACRLSRDVTRPFTHGDMDFSVGDEVLFNIRAASNDSTAWRSSDEFLPERWNTGVSYRQDVVFGKGIRACPAQDFAMEALMSIGEAAGAGYDVRFSKRFLARPIVGTLVTPPAGRYFLTRRKSA